MNDQADNVSLEYLQLRTSQGDIDAMVELGHRFERGPGVTTDEAQAMNLWRVAAEQGHAEAMSLMAHCYENCVGVEHDESAARKWHFRAAEAGHSDSQLMVATFYEEGIGVNQNFPKAATWYMHAAAQGCEEGRKQLEYLCDEMEERNFEEAGAWYRLAANQGCRTAQRRLGEFYMCGSLGVTSNTLAVEWLNKAAIQGEPQAYFLLYLMFKTFRMDDIHTVEKSFNGIYAHKLTMLDQAIAHGSSDAMCEMAELEGINQEYTDSERLSRSMAWYRKAAEQGHGDALFQLSLLYARGRGVKTDPVIACALAYLSDATEDDLEVQGFYENINPEDNAAGQAMAANWQPGSPLPIVA